MSYLRAREGDADSIAPSLYPGRPRQRQQENTDPTKPNTPHGPSTGTGTASKPADVNAIQTLPAVKGEATTAAAAAPKNAPASKDPFLE